MRSPSVSHARLLRVDITGLRVLTCAHCDRVDNKLQRATLANQPSNQPGLEPDSLSGILIGRVVFTRAAERPDFRKSQASRRCSGIRSSISHFRKGNLARGPVGCRGPALPFVVYSITVRARTHSHVHDAMLTCVYILWSPNHIIYGGRRAIEFSAQHIQNPFILS